MMQSIPVDTSRLSVPVCVTAPEPKVNLETGEIRTNREGETVYLVGVAVRKAGTRKAAVIEVATTTEPVGIAEGSPVRLVELDAVPWEMGGRHGLSYKAAAVLPHTPQSTTMAAPAATPSTTRPTKGADA
jgi:hypothetical protein